MSGDNGKIEEAKTSEQLATERLARYQANPQFFTENRDLILAVKRQDEGRSYFIGNTTPHELKIIKYDIDMQINSTIYQMIAESKSKIIPAKGSFLNFARHKR